LRAPRYPTREAILFGTNYVVVSKELNEVQFFGPKYLAAMIIVPPSAFQGMSDEIEIVTVKPHRLDPCLHGISRVVIDADGGTMTLEDASEGRIHRYDYKHPGGPGPHTPGLNEHFEVSTVE